VTVSAAGPATIAQALIGVILIAIVAFLNVALTDTVTTSGQ